MNGIECEPFLTTDHRVMLEQADDIFMGIRYLMKATGAKRTIIGIEANKQDAADHLEKMIPKAVPAGYRSGSAGEVPAGIRENVDHLLFWGVKCLREVCRLR